MFRAAVENLIDTEGLSFIPYTNDTQSLNTVALKNQIDVTAVSVAFYPFISENYFLLDHGGSVGMNYGPVIVAKEELKLPDLYSKKIATPGENYGTFCYKFDNRECKLYNNSDNALRKYI